MHGTTNLSCAHDVTDFPFVICIHNQVTQLRVSEVSELEHSRGTASGVGEFNIDGQFQATVAVTFSDTLSVTLLWQRDVFKSDCWTAAGGD